MLVGKTAFMWKACRGAERNATRENGHYSHSLTPLTAERIKSAFMPLMMQVKQLPWVRILAYTFKAIEARPSVLRWVRLRLTTVGPKHEQCGQQCHCR